MQDLSTPPHRRHTQMVLVMLVAVTISIVMTSILSGTMGMQRAAMVTNIPSALNTEAMMQHSLSGAVPFGQNADELRILLEQIHSSYSSQMEMVQQLSQQNASMLSLYQQALSSVSQSAMSTSYDRFLPSLPTASSRSQSNQQSQVSASSGVTSSVLPSSKSSSVVSLSKSSSVSSEDVSSIRSFEATSSSSVSVDSSKLSSAASVPTVSPRLSMLRQDFGRTIPTLNAGQSDIAFRLMKELTLTPLGEEYILTFITKDLPTIAMTSQYGAVVFTHFKLLNGYELKKLGVAPNADVDPKDWYAESVMTVNKLGIMQGSGKTGLFEGERSMTQAELAKTLANAMNLAGGTLPHGAAPNADIFQRWPLWAKDAISQLRARGIDTSFFRANPEEPANRLQLARAISDTVFRGDSIDSPKARFFYDTVPLPPTVQQYIAKMSALGIMTGNPQTRKFEPYAETNRAQVAKTIAYAMSVKVGASTFTSLVK